MLAVSRIVAAAGGGRIRAADDDDIRRQLEELNRQKGEVIREWEALGVKYAGNRGADGDALRKIAAEIEEAADRIDELDERNSELSDEMDELFAEAPDISDSDFENY